MHPFALPLRVPAFTTWARVTLLTILLVPSGVRPTPGEGTTPEEATAAFKAGATAAVKNLKSQLQAAKKAFQVHLEHYEDAIDNGGNVLTETTAFVVHVDEFQHAVQVAANTATENVIYAGADALEALAGGVPLNGVYPKDFYTGSGGPFDKARKDVRTQVDQLYKSLAGRLKKTVTVLKKNGAGLTLDVRPPAYLVDGVVSEEEVYFHYSIFSMDVVIAVNRTNLAEDGTVWLGGTNYISTVDIDASITGDETDATTVSPSPTTERWNATLTDGGTRFRKGNYTALAQGEGDTFYASASLSIR